MYKEVLKYLEDINISVKKQKGFRYEKKDTIEKSIDQTFSEYDKRFKRRFQAASKEEQERMGYDIPQDADEWDIEVTRQANEWLRDGQPVD